MAREFSGTGQYLTAAAGLNAPMTMSAWIYPDVTDYKDIISSAQASSSDNYNAANIVGGGYMNCSSQAGGTWDQAYIADSTTAAWFHVAAVFASTSSRILYVKGSASSPNTTTIAPATATRTMLGNWAGLGSGNPFDGRMAEAAIWSVALNAPEIQALANGASPRSIRPGSLWGYWPVHGVDSPERDLSGNARHMTLTGSPTRANHPPLALVLPNR